jgi:hypothetical protein
VINKNPEVGDSVKIHDVIFNAKNVLVSQGFAEAISRPVVLTELKEDYFKIKGFDEELPKNWIKCIVGKHSTEEERERQRDMSKKLRAYKHTMIYRIWDYMTDILHNFALVMVWFIGVGIGLFNVARTDSIVPLGMPILFCLALTILNAVVVGHLKQKLVRIRKEMIWKCIKENDISFEEAAKLNYDEILDDDFFTKEEQEKGLENLPYYVWKPTNLNPDDNKPKH